MGDREFNEPCNLLHKYELFGFLLVVFVSLGSLYHLWGVLGHSTVANFLQTKDDEVGNNFDSCRRRRLLINVSSRGGMSYQICLYKGG